MKKLVYILSLAIGLLMTGCAQWDPMESLPRDTWGAEPEITIEVSPLDSITGALISDKMDVVFYLKNATNFSFVYDEGEAQSIDFTALLKGQYGGWSAEPAVEADTLGIQLTGFEPGKTYTIYAVVANAAGVQTTAVKTVGAVDVTAPALVANSELSATNNGKQVTVAFDEAIVRTDAMPAVTYEVLNENLESYATGDATAMASGRNLVVSLPSTFEFDGFSIVLLSFAEGSVEDAYGNKMAALVNVLDEEGVPNGPWWAYDPNNAGVDDENALFKSDMGYCYYGVSTSFTQDQSETTVGSEFFNVTLAQANFDLTEYFGQPLTGDKWTMPSIMSILQGTEPADVPAFSYEAKANDGNTYTWLTFFDPEGSNGLSFVGQYDLTQAGMGVVDCYSASYDPSSNSLYTSWDFVYADRNGQMILQNAGYKPCVIFFDGENPYILFDFEDLLILDETMVGAADANFYEQPVRLENVTIVKRNFNHVIKK